ncbi:hypothetical protein FBU30_007084 [Linnemannia zychae]|nr:hypothetical protein FBU30_007084 [Linnemannia zychae]
MNGVSTCFMNPSPDHRRLLKPTNVRILVVYGAAITIPAMEAIIYRCPVVEVLMFTKIVGYFRTTRNTMPLPEVKNWSHLPKYCKRLREFNFSRRTDSVIATEFSAIVSSLFRYSDLSIEQRKDRLDNIMDQLSVFSNIHPPSLSNNHPITLMVTSWDTYTILHYIQQFQGDWLTGLVFESTASVLSTFPTNILHKFLCSCPNLTVFKVLSFSYLLEDMDVNNLLSHTGGYRTESEPTQSSARIRPGSHAAKADLSTGPRTVWSCRNLRILHLAVSTQKRDHATSAFSLVILGYLSLVCPQLEQLHLKRLSAPAEDEDGICLLGRLKHLKRLQFQSRHGLKTPDVYWLMPRHIGAIERAHELERLKSEVFMDSTLVGRMIRACQNKKHETCLLSTLKACLRKLPELPAFQARKPFLTEDGIDLGGVGRPDDLINWIYNTNRDLMGDFPLQENDDALREDGEWNEAHLPNLELFCFRDEVVNNWDLLPERKFMATQRPCVEFYIQTCDYNS